MLPPPSARGGIVECSPGSAGGIPTTPRNGATATVWPRSLTARPASASISHSSQDGGPPATPSLRVRRLSREAATVQPQSPGRRETNRTARTMPGSAP